MSYALCMICCYYSWADFSEPVEAGIFNLFLLCFCSKEQNQMKYLLGPHVCTHFSLRTVALTPALICFLSVNITAVHVPISLLPCAERLCHRYWALSPSECGDHGSTWPFRKGWQGKLSLIYLLLRQAPLMLPWDWINEMESSNLTYLCAAESRGPHCAWDAHEQSPRGLPLRGHRGDKTQTGGKNGGIRIAQPCVCLCILVSLRGVLRR